jgi:hypothetical protein
MWILHDKEGASLLMVRYLLCLPRNHRSEKYQMLRQPKKEVHGRELVLGRDRWGKVRVRALGL